MLETALRNCRRVSGLRNQERQHTFRRTLGFRNLQVVAGELRYTLDSRMSHLNSLKISLT